MLPNDMGFRTVKVFDIGYISIVYFLLGLLATLLLKNLPFFGKDYDESKDRDKPAWQLFLEVLLLMWVVGVLGYFARNIAMFLPSPLNGVSGLNHLNVKELQHSFVFMFIVMTFNTPLVTKLRILYSKIAKK